MQFATVLLRSKKRCLRRDNEYTLLAQSISLCMIVVSNMLVVAEAFHLSFGQRLRKYTTSGPNALQGFFDGH